MKLERQKPRDEAIEKIESYIIKNRLQAHDKLPSERTMCNMWNLNRSTLRSAIKQLILQGKIYNKNGSGTFVAQEKVVRNLQDVRGMHRTAADAGREMVSKMLDFSLCETSKSIGRKMELPLGHKLWRLERVWIMDGIPVMISVIHLDAERFPELDTYDFGKVSLYDVLSENYGVDIRTRYEKISISSCDEREAGYLQVEEGTPILYQSGVSRDDADKVFECFQEVTRAEYICLGSELTNTVPVK